MSPTRFILLLFGSIVCLIISTAFVLSYANLVRLQILYAQPIHVSDMINRPGPTLIRHPGQALEKQTERLPVLVPGARGPA